jgi:putative ABC transport system permease protein
VVGAVNNLPLTDYNWQTSYYVEGRPRPTRAADWEFAEAGIVAGDYFRAMGIPLRRGRYFTELDRAGSPPVMILDETVAAKYWPGQDPIGRRVIVMGERPREVVGVVAHVKHYGLDKEARVETYFPFRQVPICDLYLVVRGTAEPAAVAAAVRDQVHALDKDLATYNIRTMRARVSNSMATRRFSMVLLGTFAALALALAAIGIYGLMAYSVVQRSHEMGIRMTLGATARDVRLLVVRQALALAIAGAGMGLAGAFSLTRLMSSLLAGVKATDPGVFAGVTVLLIAVAMAASYLPSRRATQVDPVVALRCE